MSRRAFSILFSSLRTPVNWKRECAKNMVRRTHIDTVLSVKKTDYFCEKDAFSHFVDEHFPVQFRRIISADGASVYPNILFISRLTVVRIFGDLWFHKMDASPWKATNSSRTEFSHLKRNPRAAIVPSCTFWYLSYEWFAFLLELSILLNRLHFSTITLFVSVKSKRI